MPTILLAATAALVWGASDFCGGKGSQRASPLAVTVMSQIVSLPVLALGLVVIAGTPRFADLAWGMVGGVAGLIGIVLLYRGLASGAMSVVSPVTAVTAAVVPLVIGLLLDGILSALALVGTVCAVLAIALISAAPGAGGGGRVTRGLLGLALTAGAMFGFFFVILGQVSPGSGLWVMVGIRLSSIPLGLLIAARSRTSLRLSPRVLVWAGAAGSLDLLGNTFFLMAAAQGHLSIVAVLASLYPTSTVLLALAVDRERVRVVQVAGLGLAATALVMTAA
ncbi:DMT family transporter [Natronosporangium hydrolyticum]|uniref:DMT family transporter n=1 Tax=Natronosporangium hydrolyticum TaxID=2811111 RepID=UPI0023BA5C85|nr:DMT family transporter [Natronosporangium hydrolyticum]